MKLDGFKFIQSWNSLVYHLTGRGAGSFDGDQARHEAWKKEMDNSTREFIRKWGSYVKHTNLMDPIISPKYDIGFVVTNCGAQLLEFLEPWCSTIYFKDEMGSVVTEYIKKEQPNTSFNLQERIKVYGSRQPNDILISFDCSKLIQQSFGLLQQMPDIIKDNGEPGTFELDIFTITIIRMNELQSTLIKI
jgi:hypothetical protein